MELRIIDTHCHPQFPQYDADRDEVMRRALDAGVGMFCIGTDEESSRGAIALAKKYEGVWASVGIHPNDISAHTEPSSFEIIEKLAAEPKVIGIGEVGLDYFRTTGDSDRIAQARALEKFVDMAQRLGKPLIIHCRDAHDDMLRILKSATHGKADRTRGIIHSFNGTADTAFYYIELGFDIGLNGIVTFSPAYEAMIRALPAERIVLETDAPYLAPAPYRGKRNEPGYVIDVLRYIAQKRNENLQQFANNVLANSKHYISHVVGYRFT